MEIVMTLWTEMKNCNDSLDWDRKFKMSLLADTNNLNDPHDNCNELLDNHNEPLDNHNEPLDNHNELLDNNEKA